MNVQFDKMDPVFNPQITKISDGFIAKAQSEIQSKFGDLNAGIAKEYALMENVIDIKNSPAYPDTSSFSQFPSSVSFSLNAEPSMSGGLKMACTVSDALSLQYYEEPDLNKAAFGHTLTFDDWVSLTSIKEWYQEVLFSAPSVAVNVAHPLLQVILDEIQNEKRIFTFLCGHDSNVGSVLAALKAERAHRLQAHFRDLCRLRRRGICRHPYALCICRPTEERYRSLISAASRRRQDQTKRTEGECRRAV